MIHSFPSAPACAMQCAGLATRTEEAERLLQRIASHTAEIGFNYCGFGLLASYPVSRRLGLCLSNYPEEFQQKFRNTEILDADPSLQYALNSNNGLLWSIEYFRRVPAIHDLLVTQEFTHGFVQALRPRPGILQLFTLASNTGRPFDDKKSLESLASHASSQFAALLLPTLVPDLNTPLTQREKEIMRWTADGKTSSEISRILNITTRTVNFHLTNVMGKTQRSEQDSSSSQGNDVWTDQVTDGRR